MCQKKFLKIKFSLKCRKKFRQIYKKITDANSYKIKISLKFRKKFREIYNRKLWMHIYFSCKLK